MSFYKDRVVLITGASSGIGEALARQCARDGAHLVLTARRVERLANLASELEALGAQALPVACDVTRDGDLERAVAAAMERFGRIDVAVANAGFGVAGNFERLSIDDYRRQFETNFFGVLRTAKACLGPLKASRGVLALVGSVAGHIPLPGNSPYCASKFAVHALAGALRAELRGQGVAVVLVTPGFVESEIRQVNNQGTHRPDAVDPIPAFLTMPAATAAKQIASGIARRKREQVVTWHGSAAVFLQRHFGGVLAEAVARGYKGRPEPKPPTAP
jgi:short-subunit dehydrogenase